VGAFAAAEDDPLQAAAAGLAAFGLAAERAARETTATGSFKTAIFDELYELSPDRLADGARLFELA